MAVGCAPPASRRQFSGCSARGAGPLEGLWSPVRLGKTNSSQWTQEEGEWTGRQGTEYKHHAIGRFPDSGCLLKKLIHETFYFSFPLLISRSVQDDAVAS